MSFHKKIVELRKEKGLSQEQFAFKVGVSRQTVYKWETGLSQPELMNIEKICDVLEISPNQLMGYEEGQQKNKRKINYIPILIVILLFLFMIINKRQESYGFYVNDLKMNLIESDAQYQTYHLSFIPSISNIDYEYYIIVSENNENQKIFETKFNYSICTSQIILEKGKDVIIYAQVKNDNVIYLCPLMKVWGMEE